jgi:serine/threonine-protein kinase HipA
MTRQLDAFLDRDRVGTLHENAGIWSLRYDDAWIAKGFPLAPGLPLQAEIIDTGSVRPVQWFFDNLLPEEAARARLIQSQGPGPWDSWRLLERFGSESAGALTLLAPGAVLPAAELQLLPNAELEARIRNMPRAPLADPAPKKMSLAGAQEKLMVVVDAAGRLHEPVGAYPSTHILKPDALHARYPASTVNEWYCARLAGTMKLNVPAVALRYVPSCVYLIERFDRRLGDGIPQRLHALDAAQLLSLSAGFKYERSGAGAIRDIVALIRTKLPARTALFRWTVFNVLIGNADAHLKNISLLAGRAGYVLAPHYDLVSTAAWDTPELVGANAPTWPNVGLSFEIGGATSFATIRREHVLRFADDIGLPRRVAENEMNRLLKHIIPAADAILREFEARTDVPAKLRAGQLRMLHSIRHLPIQDMQRQLS